MISDPLRQLLDIQGQLLDQHLAQNLGERYMYVILVAPVHAGSVTAISNAIDRTIIEPVVDALARRLSGEPAKNLSCEVVPHGIIHKPGRA